MTPQPGRMIGRLVLDRYRIVKRLAKGGMGEIYLARNEGAAGFVRPVVIKQILAGRLGDEAAVEMFAREARIMAKLRHPGIVSVVDFAEDDGAYLMVLEYVHGYDLGRWGAYYYRAPARPFPADVAVALILRVLDALAYAHHASGMDGNPLGVVHRDIKPSNILISTEGHVQLADFGVARSYCERTTTATSSARIKGTYPYIAPEIFEGADSSPNTDVYSCAVMLYQLITGRNPFHASNPRAVVHKVLEHVPTPAAAFRKDIPEALSPLLHKALDKDPDARFPDATSLSRALRGMEGFDLDDATDKLIRTAAIDFRDPRFSEQLRVTRLDLLENALETPDPNEETTPLRNDRPAANDIIVQTAATADIRAGDLVLSPTMPTPSTATGLPDRELMTKRLSEEALESAWVANSSITSVVDPLSVDRPSIAHPTLHRGRHWVTAGMILSLLTAAAAVALVLLRDQGERQPEYVIVQREPEPERRPGLYEPIGPDTAAGALAAHDARSAAGHQPGAGAPGSDGGGSARPRPGETSSDAPELSRAFAGKNTDIVACFREHTVEIQGIPRISVRFEIDRAGRVTMAEVLPMEVAQTGIGRCIENVAMETHFGPQGRARNFRIPVTVRQGD